MLRYSIQDVDHVVLDSFRSERLRGVQKGTRETSEIVRRGVSIEANDPGKEKSSGRGV